MKKILSIAPYRFLPAENGGQKAILSFYENLTKKFSLYCICTRDNNIVTEYPFKLIPILSPSTSRYVNFFLLFSVGKLVRDIKVDCVETEHPYFGWLLFLLK